MRPPRRPTTPATSSASSRVRSIGALRAALDDRPGDAPGRGLLAVLPKDRGQGSGVGAVDHLGGAVAAARHAHVERPVGGEREAAARVAELHRGDAEIEDDPVQPAHPVRREQLGHGAKAALEHDQPGPVGGQLPGAGHGGRVAVDGKDPCRAGLQDRAGVAAGTERGVEIVAARADVERSQHLVEHHRHVAVAEAMAGARRRLRSQRGATLRARRLTDPHARQTNYSPSTLSPCGCTTSPRSRGARISSRAPLFLWDVLALPAPMVITKLVTTSLRIFYLSRLNLDLMAACLDLPLVKIHPIVIAAYSQGQSARILGNLLNPGHKSATIAPRASAEGQEQSKKTPAALTGRI